MRSQILKNLQNWEKEELTKLYFNFLCKKEELNKLFKTYIQAKDFNNKGQIAKFYLLGY